MPAMHSYQVPTLVLLATSLGLLVSSSSCSSSDSSGPSDWSKRSVQLSLFEVHDLSAPTRTAQALTASVGAQAATFQVEAITARPGDLSRAQTYPTGPDQDFGSSIQAWAPAVTAACTAPASRAPPVERGPPELPPERSRD